MYICNAPFCNNQRNYNHAYCGQHRWEREKYKVKVYKELLPLWSAKRCPVHGLIRFDQCYINPASKSKRCLICTPKIAYCSKKQKYYNQKYDSKRKNWRLKKRYGITIEEFNLILNSQNNSCAICKTPTGEFSKQLGKERNLAVDHCHETGKVRGILCYRCNMGIGFLQNNPEITNAATKYLSKY